MRKKTSKLTRLPREIFSCKNRWVALTPNGRKIVVTGKNLDLVLEQSKKLGYKDPTLIWAPKEWGLYVLLNAIPLRKTPY